MGCPCKQNRGPKAPPRPKDTSKDSVKKPQEKDKDKNG